MPYKNNSNVLSLIEACEISLTPNSFRVFYEFLEGDIDALVAIVSQEIKNNTLTENRVNEIHDQFFGAPQTILNRLSSLIETLRKQIFNLSKDNSYAEMSLSIMSKEVDSLKMQLDNEKKRSHTDSLTKLGNRLLFEEIMSKDFDDENKTVIMMDIDHFKKINDKYGHEKGDDVLRSLSNVLFEVAEDKPVESILRYGGEEFVIIVNGDEDMGIKVAESVQDKLKHMSDSSKAIPFTLSFGVAQSNHDLKHAFSNADRALYFSKNNGRNQISYQSYFEQSRGMN